MSDYNTIGPDVRREYYIGDVPPYQNWPPAPVYTAPNVPERYTAPTLGFEPLVATPKRNGWITLHDGKLVHENTIELVVPKEAKPSALNPEHERKAYLRLKGGYTVWLSDEDYEIVAGRLGS